MSLPILSEIEQQQCIALQQKILQEIDKYQGWISFAAYMQMALYEPGMGYYVAGKRKFGKQGDFVTAPEISPLFSQCLANQCQQVLVELQRGSILEFGAGSGVMAADILLALEKLECLPEEYLILEVSPDLQMLQRETVENKCSHLVSKIRWLSALPENFVGVVLANEVLDAMPVHVFEWHKNQALELGVVKDGNGFSWKLSDRVLPVPGLNVGEGYRSEVCLAIKPWLQELYCSCQQAVVLMIDYGFPQAEYYHPQRDSGTIMCHYKHHAHPDPFYYVGLQDITAHVDFTAVANAAVESGFSVVGYTNQASFLMSSGLVKYEASLDVKEQFQQGAAMKKLLLPTEMGELFKVIALSKGIGLPLQGFIFADFRHRL